MMGILGRMISRMVLARFLLILFGVSVFVITLEVLSNLDSILAQNDSYVELVKYALLRFPGIAAVFFVLGLLLAMVLTLVELGYRNEIVPIWAAGATPLQLLLMLAPMGIIMGMALFLLNDQIVPATVRVLSNWGVGEFATKKLRASREGEIWLRAGQDILRAGKANAKATQLEDIIIFRRDRTGLLTEQIHVARAQRESGRWLLHDVVIYRREPVPHMRLDTLVYAGELRLASEEFRSGDPEEMPLADLRYFIENKGFGLRPVHVYEVWWHRRLANLLVPLLIIAVCIPLAVRFRRGGITVPVLLTGITVGFTFFIFDGISLTVGELGLVPAWLAGWLPVTLLGLISAAFYVRAQTVS